MRFEKGIERAQHLRAGFRSREPVVLTFEGVDTRHLQELNLSDAIRVFQLKAPVVL
jgi:hypothetical protein